MMKATINGSGSSYEGPVAGPIESRRAIRSLRGLVIDSPFRDRRMGCPFCESESEYTGANLATPKGEVGMVGHLCARCGEAWMTGIPNNSTGAPLAPTPYQWRTFGSRIFADEQYELCDQYITNPYYDPEKIKEWGNYPLKYAGYYVSYITLGGWGSCAGFGP